MNHSSPFAHEPSGSESLHATFEWGRVWCGSLPAGSHTPALPNQLALLATDARSHGRLTHVADGDLSSHVLSGRRVAILPETGSATLHWNERTGLLLATLSPTDLIDRRINWREWIARPLVLHEEPARTFCRVLLTEGFADEPRESVLRSLTTLLLHAALDRCAVMQPHRRRTPPSPSSASSLTAVGIRAVRRYVDRHLCAHISVEDLANVAGYSSPHFSRLFKATIGVTPYRYVIERRLERAAYLLATTSRPVYDVALEVGYSQVSHFSRAFKRRFGRAPSAYRANRAVRTEKRMR